VRLDAAAPNAWTTEHYVTKERWHAFADVGRKDNGGPATSTPSPAERSRSPTPARRGSRHQPLPTVSRMAV